MSRRNIGLSSALMALFLVAAAPCTSTDSLPHSPGATTQAGDDSVRTRRMPTQARQHVNKMSEEEFQRHLRELKDGKTADIRSADVWGLTNLGDPRAVEPLCEAMQSDSSAMVRSDIMMSLGDLQDRRAVPVLIKALKEETHVGNKLTAAFALVKDFHDSTVAIPTLLDLFMKKDFEKQDWEKLLDRPDLPDSLRRQLIADYPHHLSASALKLLEEIGNQEVVRGLEKALASSDEEVRDSARAALARLRGGKPQGATGRIRIIRRAPR